MEEPSREPSATGPSEPPRPSDDSNARADAVEDRDWSAGRLSVVEADTAAAAFRPSWETEEWAAPAAPIAQLAQLAHDVAATPAPTKSFGESPAPLVTEPTKSDAAKTDAKTAKTDAKTEPAKSTKSHGQATKNGATKKGATKHAPKQERAKSAPKNEPAKAAPEPAVPPPKPVARASDRPLSNAEVRAISTEITDDYPAVVVPSSRPTKAILAGVVILVVLVVGTVWSMTGSPEAPTTDASPTATEPSTPSRPTLAPPDVAPTVAEPTVAEPAVAPETTPPTVEEPVVAPEPPAPVEVRVTVRTVPPGATLVLDGAPVTSPIVRPQDLLATSHTLEVRAEGYEPRTEAVRFDRDGTVRVELRRVPPPVVTMAPEPPRVATMATTTMATTTMATTTMATTTTMAAPSMAPVRITTMAASPMQATMAAGAGFTTDNPY